MKPGCVFCKSEREALQDREPGGGEDHDARDQG